MANQKTIDLIPDDGFVRDEVGRDEVAMGTARGVARAGDWYLSALGSASVSFVSNVAGHWARQNFMRPALEKHKQVPIPKKIPGKRAPTLQIELELPRVREEDVDERERAPEQPGRGVSIVDFYI